ncbi:hypothetical protein Tco_0741317 [Tanacetum coccineum]
MRRDLPSSSGNHSRPPPPHPAAMPSPPRHHRHHHHHILIISISMPPSHRHLHLVIITTTTPPPLSSSPPRLHHNRFILSTMAAGAFGFAPRWVRLVDEWQQGAAFGSGNHQTRVRFGLGTAETDAFGFHSSTTGVLVWLCKPNMTRAYNFQLDETRFVLDANLLREVLEITPIDQAYQFVSPPLGDAIMDFVNELGYTEVIYFVSRMAVNNLYQPWRAILSMINQCLTSKTSGHDRPRYPVLQMLWGIITSTNVDYGKLMWEEFVQAIQTFLTDMANLGSPTKKGRKDKPHVIPYCRFTKLIIFHLGRTHNIHHRSASLFSSCEKTSDSIISIVSKGEAMKSLECQFPMS